MQETNTFPYRMKFGRLIFWSRWLQAPLYAGLILVQGIYVFHFMKELWDLLYHVPRLDEAHIMLGVLGLIDVVMIANLLVMVIVGGYDIFVSRLSIEGDRDKPEWLDHVNAGTMKIKLAVSLVGISSIHLLKTFINPVQLPDNAVMWQVIIHLTFVVSALLLAVTDRIMTNTHKSLHIREHS